MMIKTSKNRWKNKINLLILCLAILIFLFSCFKLGTFTVDDSFILYRYAESIATGKGMSWNYDNIPTFGFSNYFFVLVVALGIKLGLNPIFFSKIISIIAGLISIILVGLIFKKTIKFKYYFIPSLILAIMPGFWVHTVSGMETIFFTSLIVLSSYFYISFLKENKRYQLYLLIVFLILTIFCRYEGAFVALAVIIHQIFYFKKTKLKQLIIFTLPFVFLIFLLSFNKIYFGQILPNTFYAQTGESILHVLYNMNIILKFLALVSPFILLILIRFKTLIKDKYSSFLVIQSILFLLPFILIGQRMNYLFRFYFPIVPSIIIASMVSFSIIYKENKKLFFPSLLLLFLIVYPLSAGEDNINFAKDYTSLLDNAHIKIGKTFGMFEEYSNYTIAVVVDAGAVPYYSRWRVFDYCLNDPHTPTKGFDIDYFYEQKSEAIVMTFYEGIFPSNKTKEEITDYLLVIQWIKERKEIITHENFKNYTLVAVYQGNKVYYEYVFIMDDVIDDLGDLVKELKINSNYWG